VLFDVQKATRANGIPHPSYAFWCAVAACAGKAARERTDRSQNARVTAVLSATGGLEFHHEDVKSSYVRRDGPWEWESEAPVLRTEGVVEVADPATSSSEAIQLEEDNFECMLDTPMYECWKKTGSFGIRRLHTDTWFEMLNLGVLNEDWMAHPTVQAQALFNLTLPASHDAGTYDVAEEHEAVGSVAWVGVQTQELTIAQQLSIGVRALDLRCAWSFREGALYLSHFLLLVPLTTALQEMRSFLEQHKEEVIVIYAKKGRNVHEMDEEHMELLLEEENDPTRVPGQLVHEAVFAEFGSMLALHKTLRNLRTPQNPSVQDLVHAGIRVVYFWESQQVLCVSFEECSSTPGWMAQRGAPLAFGPGFPLGVRATAVGEIIEPACLKDSWYFTQSINPTDLVERMKVYAGSLDEELLTTQPPCFSLPLYQYYNKSVPALHDPPVLHLLDGQVTPNVDGNNIEQVRRNVQALFSRGEGFTAKSEAERTNYLMLMWFMKKGRRQAFTQANMLAHDFVSPILITRLIEAAQQRTDCGFALYCKETGSCWAMTLLDREDTCRSEVEVVAILQEHAGDRGGLPIFWLVLILLLCTWCCCATTFVCCIFWWDRAGVSPVDFWRGRCPKRRADSGLLDDPVPDAGSSEAEAEGADMLPQPVVEPAELVVPAAQTVSTVSTHVVVVSTEAVSARTDELQRAESD